MRARCKECGEECKVFGEMDITVCETPGCKNRNCHVTQTINWKYFTDRYEVIA